MNELLIVKYGEIMLKGKNRPYFVDTIKSMSVEYFQNALNNKHSFKIETRRADKSFSYKTQEMNTILGQHIADHFPHLTVDVHDPEITLFVNIRKEGAYLYQEKQYGAGGLPV